MQGDGLNISSLAGTISRTSSIAGPTELVSVFSESLSDDSIHTPATVD